MKTKTFLIILLSVFLAGNISAQKSSKKTVITGTVLDADKNPIPNAIIMIDDKNTNVITDANGYYKIKVKPTASRIGVFTFGNGTKTDSIGGRTKIDFNFSGASVKNRQVNNEVAPGEEGVNSGYGVVKKKNLTTDVHKIDGTNKKYASYATIAEMIQREVAGVKIQGDEVIIQDSQDLFGSVPALVVVDGVSSYSLPSIPPIQVKSIEVLKGTAAAIYGSRAYGGVLVIKTKVQQE